MSGTSSKLRAKWKGPYKLLEVIQDGLIYVVEDPYSGKQVQRAVEKVKPYVSWAEVIPEMEEEEGEELLEEEDVSLPPRHRQPPRRLIEEC